MTPDLLLENLQHAFNTHDIDALIACFADDYVSEQPVYPDRAFQGREQVRKNWSSNFIEMPDFNSSLVSSAIAGDLIWTEWHWKGTRQNHSTLEMRGVILFQTVAGKIKSAKLYMEPLKTGGSGIEAAVKEIMQGKQAGNA